jgi:hypothetical protein
VSKDNQPMVTLVGNTTLISSAVERAVKRLGYLTRRVNGGDRYAVAAALAGDPANHVEGVVVVDGEDLPVVASVGAVRQSAILLTRGSTLPDAARSHLARIPTDATVYPVGPAARAAVAAAGWRGKVVPVASPAAMLDRFGSAADTVIVARRSSMEDLVVSAALRGRHGGAQLVLVDAAGIGTEARAWLDLSSARIDRTVVVDGRGAISRPTEATIGKLVCGPLGYTAFTNATMT